VSAFFLIVAVTVTPSAVATGGALDRSFGEGGKVITHVTRHGDEATAVAIQADGKIVVAGSSFGPNPRFALVRYRKDGSLNATFGGDGKITTDFTKGADGANAVAIQADGKIVAAGHAGFGDFALARYNTDGTLDSTFGRDGRVRTDLDGDFDVAYALAISADGKILVAGGTDDAGDQRTALVRYTTDGTLDPTFGGDGTVIGLGGYALDVAILPDGKILTSNPVVRYNADGSSDHAFGGGRSGSDMAIQTDGKIVSGWTDLECFGANDCDYWFVLSRQHADGTNDSTFGEDGELIGRFGWLADIATQSDGKIVVATGGGAFALVRYLADGTLDNAFGGDGFVFTGFPGRGLRTGAVAIQSDERIVVIGTAGRWNSELSTFALARFLP
jgi:uncharacterized delta-60 repeat protein